MKFTNDAEGLAAAQEKISQAECVLLNTAIEAKPIGRLIKLATVFEGWDQKSKGDKSMLGGAFRRLVKEGLFPLVQDLGGEDNRNHARYRRVRPPAL